MRSYAQPDSFFGGQRTDALFIELACDIPPRYVTPPLHRHPATALLSDVLNQTTARVNSGQVEGLDRDIRRWLKEARDDLHRRIEFGTFD